MTIFVESLSRLYHNKSIKIDKLNELLSNGKISKEEYEYILKGAS